MQAKNGSMVNVHYKGTLKDGTEFDNSHTRGQTFSFQLGSGKVVPGFNDAVMGMAVGEKKQVTISPLDAYGPRLAEAEQVVPRASFGEEMVLEVGTMVQGRGPRGAFLAKVKDLEDETVTLDLNHPLAGEELSFEIELVSIDQSIDPASAE